jgi:hypothetical protein
MRFPNTLFQLLAIGKGGAIMEPADAELRVPNTLQNVLTLPAPLVIAPGGTTLIESSGIGAAQNFAGVTAAQIAKAAQNFAAGIWELNWNYHQQFTPATLQAANWTSFSLERNDGNFFEIAKASLHANGATDQNGRLVIHFLDATWTVGVRLNNPLGAGDALAQSCVVMANRLL